LTAAPESITHVSMLVRGVVCNVCARACVKVLVAGEGGSICWADPCTLWLCRCIQHVPLPWLQGLLDEFSDAHNMSPCLGCRACWMSSQAPTWMQLLHLWSARGASCGAALRAACAQRIWWRY